MPKNPNTPEKYRVRRARLVEALRDGSYTQTANILCDGESYCCLGVGSDLMRKEAKKGTWGKELESQEGSDVGLPFVINPRQFVAGTDSPRRAVVTRTVRVNLNPWLRSTTLVRASSSSLVSSSRNPRVCLKSRDRPDTLTLVR